MDPTSIAVAGDPFAALAPSGFRLGYREVLAVLLALAIVADVAAVRGLLGRRPPRPEG